MLLTAAFHMMASAAPLPLQLMPTVLAVVGVPAVATATAAIDTSGCGLTPKRYTRICAASPSSVSPWTRPRHGLEGDDVGGRKSRVLDVVRGGNLWAEPGAAAERFSTDRACPPPVVGTATIIIYIAVRHASTGAAAVFVTAPRHANL